MPTRKQRRKRQKELRHEWEEVYVDAEGRELEPEEVEEILPPKPERKPGARGRQQQSQARGGRAIQPPSWRRVLKRAAIFAPLMYVFLYFVTRNDPEMGPQELVIQTAMLLLIFLPFSYLMDSFTYRLWKKRQAKPKG
ncbi:MAG: hypothetical protein WD981_07915 [Gaiellaceae bacterium]